MDDDELDARLAAKLRQEIHRQLDGQLGRSERQFRQSLDSGANQSAVVRRRLRWVAPLSGLAAAACLALIVGHFAGRRNAQLPQEHPGAKTVATIPETNAQPTGDEQATSPTMQRALAADADADAAPIAAVSQPLLVARALRSRAIDEGTLLLDGRAVRKIRRQWLERVEWFDPQHGARLEKIVPREQVLFLPLSIN